MDFLWKKESNSGLYVNLFEGVSSAVRNEFDKIESKFKENQEFHFLAKDNGKSLDCRNAGNDCFKRKDWEKAMTWYNKSLCFAENGTENIGLAYANRSSCFMHLKMYAKCLVDIELATQANYPEHMMPKLLKRQKDCIELIKNGAHDKSESHSPSLSYEANSKFPGMANVLEMQSNNKFGRLIIAQSDIPAGKIVLIERAFASQSFNLDHCHTCLKTTMNFVPCEHCSWGIFCHDSCAKQNVMHQVECGESLIGMRQLEHSDTDVANDFLNMGSGRVECGEFYETVDFLKHSTLEILSNFSNDAQSLIDFVEDAIQPIASNIPIRLDDTKSMYRALLQLNAVTVHANRKILFVQQAYVTFNYLLLRKDIQKQFDTEQKKRFLMHLILHQNCVIFLNGFSTHDGRMNAFVLFSYLNHACASNLRCISKANMRYGITLRPIKAGQQLFISYLTDVFGDTSVEETQREMFENFGFRCSNCERCKPNEMLSLQNSKLMQNDEDYRFLTLQSSEWRKINDGRSEKEKQKILKEMTIGVLNRFGSNHWCDELASMMEYYDNFIFD